MSAIEVQRQYARLAILRGISEQPDQRWNSVQLREDLELRSAINRPREWVNDELRWLAEMGAVALQEHASVLIAMLTQKGLDHLSGRIVISGVARPAH
ncbi:hypothetical protein IY145_10790 [Methylosinus sp. H3A]|uniref:VpaChn25_0724 family phage protein n=1 Tax=Methylosinus sp. H3A TaxID=2785786 RepID=UPI0018C21ACE|nr:hypothetical protein [Methylosinus sp. H3A]MBG0809865.1 hypothetical protein [Methylosinus sp. H3A]